MGGHDRRRFPCVSSVEMSLQGGGGRVLAITLRLGHSRYDAMLAYAEDNSHAFHELWLVQVVLVDTG